MGPRKRLAKATAAVVDEVNASMPMQYYRSTPVGVALVRALNSMMEVGEINIHTADAILKEYDDCFQAVLREHVHVEPSLENMHCTGVLEGYNSFHHLWKIEASNVILCSDGAKLATPNQSETRVRTDDSLNNFDAISSAADEPVNYSSGTNSVQRDTQPGQPAHPIAHPPAHPTAQQDVLAAPQVVPRASSNALATANVPISTKRNTRRQERGAIMVGTKRKPTAQENGDELFLKLPRARILFQK